MSSFDSLQVNLEDDRPRNERHLPDDASKREGSDVEEDIGLETCLNLVSKRYVKWINKFLNYPPLRYMNLMAQVWWSLEMNPTNRLEPVSGWPLSLWSLRFCNTDLMSAFMWKLALLILLSHWVVFLNAMIGKNDKAKRNRFFEHGHWYWITYYGSGGTGISQMFWAIRAMMSLTMIMTLSLFDLARGLKKVWIASCNCYQTEASHAKTD
ncbi:uncharacterized protein BO97DRAFT_419873 [Aspergillus homomorphus CBS 101889]|uniref:Uncharacterized protein n=1 Tax=Aspergillus homomorphus (strain CBS 101889) TaxID=1450537 RepID=A0A395IBQ8_ASPHC|nr:hypothetical protein BO97DRAFT_419873 [Aspergillus homomorphus CBS 101889]RAL17637.1 hypothetical protein BO97DRAFT_419873 [Aspergillus homomorphus CBS 101889]